MKRILCYGDSNTFGTAPMPDILADPIHDKATRWAGVMAATLGPDFDVVVEGLPGRTTALDDPIEGAYLNGATSLRTILSSHYPIDLLILFLGTNDAKGRFGLNAQDIALGAARLVIETARLGLVARTLVVCPPPVREVGDLAMIFEGAEARMADLPRQMERFATANGADFMDAGKIIAVDPLDGVHFSAAAHDALGQAMADKVQELLG